MIEVRVISENAYLNIKYTEIYWRIQTVDELRKGMNVPYVQMQDIYETE